MRTKEKIRRTFREVPDALAEWLEIAIGGVGEQTMYKAVEKNGSEAARQVLRHLTDLPIKGANCATTEQFVIGYLPRVGDGGDAMALWEKLLAEAFELAMIDLQEKPELTPAFAERMSKLIRDASEFAAVRLVAWGAPEI